MEIEIERSTLQVAKWIGVLLLVVLIGLVGAWQSPRDDQGLPLILSPRRRAIRSYLAQVESWSSRMADAGDRLDQLMPQEAASEETPPLPTPPAPENAPTSLYQRAEKARRAKQALEQIAAEMEVTKPPDSLRGVRDVAQMALEAHLAWAEGTLVYVGSPGETPLQELKQIRADAYIALEQLRGVQ